MQGAGLATRAVAPATCVSSSSRRCTLPAAAAAAPRLAAGAARGGGSSLQQQRQQQRQGRGRLLVAAAVKVVKGKQILCNKTMKAKEGSGEAVAQLCADVAEFAKQRVKDRSSGVLAYEISEDDYEKGTFHFLELYASQKSMADHNAAPEITRFVQQLQDLLDGPMGMVLYEYSSDGKIGPASMEGEVKGEGGLDDATGANRFGGGASMRQTSNVVDLTKIQEKDDEEKGIWGLKNFKLELPGIKVELPWLAKKKKDDK